MRRMISLCLMVLFVVPMPVIGETIGAIENETIVVDTEEKRYCSATLEDNFEEGVVLVTLKKSATKINSDVDASFFYSCAKSSEISSVIDLTRITNPDALEWIDPENYHQILRVEIPQKGKEAVLSAIKKLEQHDDVLAAFPNYIITREMPDDNPVFESDQQTKTDANVRSVSVNDPHSLYPYNLDQQIELTSAWEMTTGSSTVLVGVVDSGIDSTHEDLQGNLNVTMGRNFAEDGVSPWTDLTGHGTHVAGIIGARANNSKGIAGVCWSVQMVSLRVFRPILQDDGTIEDRASFDAVIGAITYATSQKIPILNFSGGFVSGDSDLVDALSAYPGLFVCAAGNGEKNQYGQSVGKNVDVSPVYPACYTLPNVLSVAATLLSGNSLWSGSNYGSTSVDIAAPGANIVSAFPTSLCDNGSCKSGEHVGRGYHKMNGTSMATPYVTGVAALLLSYYPAATTQMLRNAILNNVTSQTYLSGKVATGGTVNARKALASLSDYQRNVTGKFVCGDFNGDGIDDAAAIADYGSNHMQIRVSLFNGSGVGKGQVWFDSTSFDADTVVGRITAGDFNGDGKDDIAMMCDYSATVANKSTIFVFLSNGTSFGTWPETWFTTTSFNANKVTWRFAAGDFNGDGKDDIAAMYDYSYETPNKITMFIFKSTGYSFGGWPETWYTTTGFNANKVTNRFVAGDFNNDGKDDIAAMYDYNYQTPDKSTWFVFRSVGTAFSGWPETWFTSTAFNAARTTGTVAAGDFNGDGKDDIAAMYNQDTSSTHIVTIFVFLSNGSSFGGWPGEWILERAYYTGCVDGQYASGDINGDGKDDIVTLYDYNYDTTDLFRKIVFRSAGTYFTSHVYS